MWGDGRTGISWETSRTILDENKVPESKEEELARNVVTVEAFGSAERRYAEGLNKAEREGDILQEIDLNAWEKDLRFKRYNSDSRSREMDSLELSMTCDLGDWYDLRSIFIELTVEEDLWEDGYHLDILFNVTVDPFGEEQIDLDVFRELVNKKKTNALFAVFKQDHNYTMTWEAKRKRSPEGVVETKMRRMTISEDCSPKLKQSTAGNRVRRYTVGDRTTSGRKKVNSPKCGAGRRTGARSGSNSSPGPRQRLITQLWKEEKKSNEQ